MAADENPGKEGRGVKKILSRMGTVVKEILYPEGATCLECGRISDGRCLCPECRKALRGSDLMGSWDSRDLQGAQAWSIRPHRGIARDLVIRLKHGAAACAAEELAGLLEDRPSLFPVFPPETVVTWVPMPAARRRERCIDHGRALAECMARKLGLCCRQLLNRRGNGHTQEGLSMARRQKNLRTAFAPAEEIGFPVLLVDDVLTTGTTAARCIAALREGGAREITVLTMTKAL